jgi:glycosyltransferase involved in cell wall biosynthesis
VIKIGVDARHLAFSNSGIHSYLENLLIHAIERTTSTHKWLLYSPCKISQDYYKYKNVEVHAVSFPPKLKLFHFLYLQLAVPILARVHNINIFWSPANRLPIFLSKKISSVLTIHDVVYIKHPKTMRFFGYLLDKLFLKSSAIRADIVLTVSQSSKDDILHYGISSSSNTYVVPNAPKKKQRTVSKLESDYILFVGSIEPRKNIHRLISAYDSLSENLKEKNKLVIVGADSWGRYNIHSLIKSSESCDYIKFKSNVDDNSLTSLYAHAKFLVLPSLYEGFGLPIVEAMSYGIPVLTSDNSSMPEVAGDAGYYINPLSIKSIASGLEEMMTNTTLRKKLANNAISNASRYSWEESATLLIKVFDEFTPKRSIR